MCESTCYSEPILIYGEGAVVNMYQVMMRKKHMFKLVTVSEQFFESKSKEGQIVIGKSDYKNGIFSKNNLSLRKAKLSDQDQLRKDHVEIYTLNED